MEELQLSLESLHAVDTGLDVRDYLVNDEIRREIEGSREGLPEQLFIRESVGETDLALYIAPSVLATLQKHPPEQGLTPDNFEAYCIALEGVSHFVLYAFRAVQDLPVSALELELQAEVDKFVSAWMLLESQGVHRRQSAPELAKHIFENYELRPEITGDEVDRYHTAARAAHGYCRSLVKKYGRDSGRTRLHSDVRRFYRRGLSDKLRAA
jgi:hypothetical protein